MVLNKLAICFKFPGKILNCGILNCFSKGFTSIIRFLDSSFKILAIFLLRILFSFFHYMQDCWFYNNVEYTSSLTIFHFKILVVCESSFRFSLWKKVEFNYVLKIFTNFVHNINLYNYTWLIPVDFSIIKKREKHTYHQHLDLLYCCMYLHWKLS